ncbi:LOW QUALITY PROTEIN: hypothetical protein HID58_065304 [Brassica napus]|uniref:Uncharacterized protein n=1 Tax=Brassica napus TaxID=3708 RepID=A0ABQ7ZCE6_BRANA|nr:LOW QUALITY PROTEIN: hypothetical protein HID58_065304 [Brassica napus]
MGPGSQRTAIFVGQISVESGYVVNKLGSPKFIGSRGFFVFSVLENRKQQKLLDKAREMERVPDLSALLKGKLQLLSKKITPDVVPESTNSEEAGASKGRDSVIVDEDVALFNKQRGESPMRLQVQMFRLEKQLLSARLLRARKRRRRRKGRKGPEKRPLFPLITMICQENDEKPHQKISSVEAVPRPIADRTTPVDSAGRKSLSPGTPLEKRRRLAAPEGGSRSRSAAIERSAPDSATRRGARSEGGTREMPQIGDLYFKDEWIDAAFTRARVTADNLEIDGIVVREEGTEDAGTEGHVLVSDTSSGEQEDEEEESDRAEKTSSPKSNEEETNNKVEKRSVSSIPSSNADLLVPTSSQVEGPITFVSEDPSAPSVLNGDDEDPAA